MFSFNRNNPNILRTIKDSEKIYLTFDDGPDPDCTPQVLDLLLDYKVKSSFFVIGNEASRHSSLLNRMLKEGHALYSHSIDHKYNNFFASEKRLQQWVQKSQDQ